MSYTTGTSDGMKTYDPLVITRLQSVNGHSSCGYCHGTKPDPFPFEGVTLPAEDCLSRMVGTTIIQGTSELYDDMMNTGFRRSGTFIYKNDLLRSCCRLFTIRTSIKYLKLDKQHRRTINRFIDAISSEPKVVKKHKNQQKYDITSLIKAEQSSPRFYTKFEKAQFTKQKFLLYKKYQVAVHNDKPRDVTEDGFERFLCTDPFPREEKEGTPEQWDQLNAWIMNWKDGDVQFDASHKRIGPTHECYYLDGKLIAFAVLDMLPSGVSSIYFVWDPDYAHLSLGNLAGLRELLMCHSLKLGYYYLGLYAVDAAKLRYKANFGGELLDLCNATYVPLADLEPLIANGRFFTIDRAIDPIYKENREIELHYIPRQFEETPFYGKELINIAPKMFGSMFATAKDLSIQDTIYTQAEKFRLLIEQEYGADFELSTLPEVMPGIMPMFQLYGLLKSGAIHKRSRICVCKIQNFRLVLDPYSPRTFGEAEPIEKSIHLNCVRVFGLAICESLVRFGEDEED